MKTLKFLFLAIVAILLSSCDLLYVEKKMIKGEYWEIIQESSDVIILKDAYREKKKLKEGEYQWMKLVRDQSFLK